MRHFLFSGHWCIISSPGDVSKQMLLFFLVHTENDSLDQL